MGEKKTRGLVLVAAGAVLTLSAALAAYREKTSDSPRFSMAVLVLMAMAAVVAVASGVATLASVRREEEGETDEPADYRHTYRLFGLLGIVLMCALVARSWAVPSTFGQYGYYRGGAPADARAARVPRFQGKQACKECHDFQFDNHEKDVHRSVQCEDCHGPGDVHVAADEKTGNVTLHKTKEWCLVCHRQLPARPGAFPQVEWREHYKFVGVRDDKVNQTECINCHDPHEPLFLQKPLAEARLHPLIHRCRDCHLGRSDEKLQRPPDHPAIFECGYCHSAKVKDFETSPHYQVKCTTCHLFQKESDFAGRIVLNRDPRFCLLCHGKTEFRDGKDASGKPVDDEAAKLIEWPQHLKAVNAGPEYNSDSPCIACHRPQVHGDTPPPANPPTKEKAHE
jgi:hypothetical protein